MNRDPEGAQLRDAHPWGLRQAAIWPKSAQISPAPHAAPHAATAHQAAPSTPPPQKTKPAELPVRVPERAAQPLVGARGRHRGPGPTEVPPPLLAGTRTSTRGGPPMAAPGRHPGRSASFKARRAACACNRASLAAFGRAQGPPARSRADGGPTAAAGRHTHEHPRWAPDGRSWSPSGSIRLIQSPQSCLCL